MATDAVLTVTLAVIGTLAAIVYSLRILVLLERRIARIDKHIELVALNVLRDEEKQLSEEQRIEAMLRGRAPAAPKAKPAARKSASAKKRRR